MGKNKDKKYNNIGFINHLNNDATYNVNVCRDDDISEEIDISNIYHYLCENYAKFSHVLIKLISIDEYKSPILWNASFETKNAPKSLSLDEIYLQYELLKVMINIHLSICYISKTPLDKYTSGLYILEEYKENFMFLESLNKVEKLFSSKPNEAFRITHEVFSNYKEYADIIKPYINPMNLRISPTEDVEKRDKIIKIFEELLKLDNDLFPIHRLFNKNLDAATISSGESSQICLNTAIHTAIKKIIVQHNKENQDNTIILILDEPEARFHPEYARGFIKGLVDFLSSSNFIGYNFQIIISTHSPFILSDIDSNDVILIDDGKIINQPISVFGSNIHTLLRNSFFLKTPMGEFAKFQIDGVYKFLADVINIEVGNTQSQMTKEKAKYLISLVGEPIIKNKLLMMYNKKFGDDKELQIEALRDDITQLKENLSHTSLDSIENDLRKILGKIDAIKSRGIDDDKN